MRFIHERANWPAMTWEAEKLLSLVAAIRHKQGLLFGRMSALGFSFRNEVRLETLTLDVVKSSAIEGEKLNTEQVRSSIAQRLGLDGGGITPVDRHVDGVVEMMMDATQNYDNPLTEERLFGWHSALFPTGHSGIRKIRVGAWRSVETGPMQVVSGPIGHETVHFEAPEARRLNLEMKWFLDWFNQPITLDPVIKAGMAHFWFVTIHPFEDGNGRIARAIADLALARADDSQERFYSMSAQIERERQDYYVILERCQKGDLDITLWMEWFLNCLDRAIESADAALNSVLRKVQLWERANCHPINERQRVVINRLLDNFVGHLTSSKYAKLAKCSQDTAQRDIRELVSYGILLQNPGGGRSTNYRLFSE